ncbi:MAG: MerR family transcriptional regulator [Candidatus Wallbacteria bacterium]|nr:MerR family transcriptional regulator [Candidatus Wallbacteria bacterium]
MEGYTVNRLAEMADVSVRTLHHYDQIGLLKPDTRTEAGYRLYGMAKLLRLQQILFYRELGFELKEIRKILDHPEFEPVGALENHRELLGKKIARLKKLLATVDSTIKDLKGERKMLKDEELYEGFSKEQIERYKKEVREKYDPVLVQESKRRIGKMSKEQWNAVKTEGGEIARLLGKLLGRKSSDPEVQKLIARHHAWIENFYPAPAEVYRGLGQLYTDNPEFRAFYEKYGKNLADFMKEAIEYYCGHDLKK